MEAPSSPVAHLPSSPPLTAFEEPVSPTSSEPPLFSSDLPWELDDVSNYVSPREKRKRAGPYWRDENTIAGHLGRAAAERGNEQEEHVTGVGSPTDQETFQGTFRQTHGRRTSVTGTVHPDVHVSGRLHIQTLAYEQYVQRRRELNTSQYDSEMPPPPRKHRKLERNNDSGICMASDGSEPPSDYSPPAWALPVSPVDELIASSVQGFSDGTFRDFVSMQVHNNADKYDFENGRVQDEWLRHLSLLNQVIYQRLDPGNEAPAVGQYRSMVPRFTISLCKNQLQHLHPSLLSLENVAYLSLRDNNIEELPPKIGQMGIQQLDISHNKLTSFPHNLIYLLDNGPGGRFVTFANPLVYRPGVADIKFGHIGADLDDPDIINVARKSYDDTGAEYWLWQIAFIEHFSRIDRNAQSKCLIGATPISHYDEQGRLLPGSTPLIGQRLDDRCVTRRCDEVYIKTSRGIHPVGVPDFEPPKVSNAPSLASLSLAQAIKSTSSISEVFELFPGDEAPHVVTDGLKRAETNQVKYHSTFLECPRCKKDYLFARAAWVEFWVNEYGDVLPFLVPTCSWNCAEQMHIKNSGPLASAPTILLPHTE